MANPFSVLDFDDDGVAPAMPPGGAAAPGGAPPPNSPEALIARIRLALEQAEGALAPPNPNPSVAAVALSDAKMAIVELASLELPPGLQGDRKVLNVRWRILSVDSARYSYKAALQGERYAEAREAISKAKGDIKAASSLLDETYAWMSSDAVVPPHMAALVEEYEGFAAIVEMLKTKLQVDEAHVNRLIVKLKEKIARLLPGREGALARVGAEAWMVNHTRPGWQRSDPAAKLAELRERLEQLQRLYETLRDVSATLAALHIGGPPAAPGVAGPLPVV